MNLELHWQLPGMYRREKILSKISWDGQVYFACQQCSWEERWDPAFVSDSEKALNDVKCKQCGTLGLHLVRHLEHCVYQCEDCTRHFQVESTGFEVIRCPDCLSLHLFLLSTEIDPPFPPRFGAGVLSKEHPWGESAEEDGMMIAQEIRGMNLHPDFPLYSLWGIRFCRRLRLYGGYKSKEDLALICNFEGNFLRDYFRSTRELPAGIEALALFEESVRLTDEPLQRALVEHNVAMVVYSLLSQFSEDLVSTFARRPHIKMEGIASAERALAVFERESFQEMTDFPMQCARIHHILGDLLIVGQTDDTQLEQAIDHYNKALQSGKLPANIAIWVRDSRARAISAMSNPTAVLRSLAIEDLEQVIRLDESDRAWSNKWQPLVNLSQFYIDAGKLGKALPLLERAAALALDEIEIVVDEDILQQKGQLYVSLFERLAWLYVRLNKAQKALSAIETLRAATVRLYTMSETERERREKLVASRARKSVFNAIFSGKPSHVKVSKLHLESIDARIHKLMQSVNDARTAFITFTTFSNETATAILVTAKKLGKYEIYALQWQAGTKVSELISAYQYLDPSPLRERRLQRLCQLGYEILFAPLLPLLRKLGIMRLAISAPGMLSFLPFEAFSQAKTSLDFVGDYFEVFYLPSLTLGSDLVGAGKRSGSGRLLVVGYQGSDLPYTLREIQTLKDLWKDRMILLDGDACTKRRVLTELKEDYDYIHFTCHGSFDLLKPLDSALHLVSDAQRDSQRITARDILDLRFQHRPVITLSACSSALTSYNITNDCTGLTGSFLRSGARCVIGSRWPVYDDVATLFMVQLYDKMRKIGVSPQRCMHEVQYQMARSVGIEDWAAFGYLGLP